MTPTFYRLLLRTWRCARNTGAQVAHPARVTAELIATKPNQVGSWDITKLHGPANAGNRRQLLGGDGDVVVEPKERGALRQRQCGCRGPNGSRSSAPRPRFDLHGVCAVRIRSWL